MRIRLKVLIFAALMFTFLTGFSVSAESGEVKSIELIAKSDTAVSVKYNLAASTQSERNELKKATIIAYVNEQEAWRIRLVDTDSNHTSIAVLKNLEPDTEYDVTIQVTYGDGAKAPVSDVFKVRTLADQSKVMGRNIAFGKDAYSDSKIGNMFGPELLTNGNASWTFFAHDVWSSANNTNDHWAYVDLGKSEYFNRVVIKFYGCSDKANTTFPYAVGFRLEGSNDASEWTEIKSVTDNDQRLCDYTFDAVQYYRYVRIYLTKPYGNDVRLRVSEMEVYSCKGIDSIEGMETAYTVGEGQVIENYVPKACYNDGTKTDMTGMEYTIRSLTPEILSVDGHKVTVLDTGAGKLEIATEYGGITKKSVVDINAAPVAVEKTVLQDGEGNELPGLLGGAEIAGHVRCADFTGNGKDLTALICVYDADGIMTDAAVSEIRTALPQDGSFADIVTGVITLPDDITGYKVKLHIIDGFSKLNAYINSPEFEEGSL